MTKFIVILAWLLLMATCSISDAWTTTTPNGILIKARDRAINQYEEHWLYEDWNEIEWEALDEAFTIMNGLFETSLNPQQLRVVIRPWNKRCVDKEQLDTKEMRTAYGCLDGYYRAPNTIVIHMGDDEGQGNDAFVGTAFFWELNRHFLYHTGDPSWHTSSPHIRWLPQGDWRAPQVAPCDVFYTLYGKLDEDKNATGQMIVECEECLLPYQILEFEMTRRDTYNYFRPLQGYWDLRYLPSDEEYTILFHINWHQSRFGMWSGILYSHVDTIQFTGRYFRASEEFNGTACIRKE